MVVGAIALGVELVKKIEDEILNTAFLLRTLASAVAITLSMSAAGSTVAVDVGHTLKSGGSTSVRGVPEFVYNQRLAMAITNELLQSRVEVLQINADGTIPSLAARTASAYGARLFVSIHHDSVQQQFLPVTDQRFSGFSLWVSHKNKDFRGSLACAKAIGDKLLEMGFTPSSFHADMIPGESRQAIDVGRGIFVNDNLLVLKTADSASVLVEAGVIVNPVEEARLNDPRHVAMQAKGIASGIRACVH